MIRTLLIANALTLLSIQAHAFWQDPPPSCLSGALDTAAAPARSDADPRSLQVLALTQDGRLACMSEAKPGKAKVLSVISGLQVDTRIVGIDYRVQDGLLYGVGDAGGVYRIDVASGLATLSNRLSVALSGTRFGVDFNPAADRLRIVSDTGQNLRHNVAADGVTLNDGALNYSAGISATGIVSAAYTNNDLSPAASPTNAAATGTTLFVLDATQDQIALQSPPNAGSLVATGKLQMDVSEMSGFDIYSVTRGGITVSNRALASFTNAEGLTTLAQINLLTGKATPVGALPAGMAVIDIAIPLNQR